MQSIVLYSPADPALLVKAYEMLLEGGVKDSIYNDYVDRLSVKTLVFEDDILSLFITDCRLKNEKYTLLTPENLNESVRIVLENFKKENNE